MDCLKLSRFKTDKQGKVRNEYVILRDQLWDANDTIGTFNMTQMVSSN